ncbi:hypothetical protein K9K77_00975 [Candidatus Babeliales bacterium]|nr:hypothetical protein [Candidatus Babeliales bacterium]
MKQLLYILFIPLSLYSWELSTFHSKSGNKYQCNINDTFNKDLLDNDLQEICNYSHVKDKDAEVFKSATINIIDELLCHKTIHLEYIEEQLASHCSQFKICQNNPKQWALDVLESLCYRFFGKASIAREAYKKLLQFDISAEFSSDDE